MDAQIISLQKAKDDLAEKQIREFSTKMKAVIAAISRRDRFATQKLLQDAREIHEAMKKG